MGDWDEFDGALIVVEKRNKTGTDAATGAPVFDDAHPIVVYAGSANVYDKKATIIMTPALGQVVQRDQIVIIDTLPLPLGIAEGNRVRVVNTSGATLAKYLATHVHYWDFEPVSIEIECTMQDAW